MFKDELPSLLLCSSASQLQQARLPVVATFLSSSEAISVFIKLKFTGISRSLRIYQELIDRDGAAPAPLSNPPRGAGDWINLVINRQGAI